MGVELALSLLDGLAPLIYSVRMVSTNLEAMVGNRMKQILERLTANRFLGVLVGVGITALIQSSSATAVMTVGSVNSGLMTLKQVIWIIMGANVGTTITGQLIVLDIGALASLIAFMDAMLSIFVEDKEVQHVGGIVADIGVLFIGMGMISDAMVPLRDPQAFIHMVTEFSNPLLEIFAGAVFTTVVQSSSASVGILQVLAMGDVINLYSAVFVLFGRNIGTCITALLASIETNRNAKWTTLIHLMFNTIGTALFVTLCILTPFTNFVAGLTPDDPVAQIANAHTMFNISTTLIPLPFGSMLEEIAIAFLPNKRVLIKDADRQFEDLVTSKHHLGVSTTAISQIHDEITQILDTAAVNVSESFMAVANGPRNDGVRPIEEREEEIDLSNVRISKKIPKILVLGQTPRNVDTLSRVYTILGNIKRIGDHAMNLAEYVETIEQEELSFSGYAQKGFKTMEETCREGIGILRGAMNSDPEFRLSMAEEIEQRINDITLRFRQNQIDRVREGNCNMESSILYSEMLTDYERIDDHMLSTTQAYATTERPDDGKQTAAATVASQDGGYRF